MSETDRIKFDVDSDGYETETVDEFVLSGQVHFEMLSDNGAYLIVHDEYGAEDRFDLWAAPVSRAARRDSLRRSQDRLIDHLGCLLPWRWTLDHPRGCSWSIPVHRRPRAAVRDWWTARRNAGVRLTVREES